MGPRITNHSFDDRLDRLIETKVKHAQRRVELLGPSDGDEQGNVPLPVDRAIIVDAISAYFACLSPEFRQYIVNRVINGD